MTSKKSITSSVDDTTGRKEAAKADARDSIFRERRGVNPPTLTRYAWLAVFWIAVFALIVRRPLFEAIAAPVLILAAMFSVEYMIYKFRTRKEKRNG